MSVNDQVLQLHGDGRLRHLLTLEGLPRSTLERLLDRAQALADSMGSDNRIFDPALRQRLPGSTVCNLFFETSTRTRSSFQLAAQRLGADVLNFDAATSSTSKGETDIDTLRTIEAMGVACFAVRHPQGGVVADLARHVKPGTALINAGDGRESHPTQGLLNMLTLRQARGTNFSGLTVAIVGDIKHSRVARSDLHALRTLGAGTIRVCGPASLLPDAAELHGCEITEDFGAALGGADVLMMLRLQRERMQQGLVSSLEDYFRDYGLTQERLAQANPGAVVMHPGPMNRGVEISDVVADGSQSLILRQVANGVAVRMAVLLELLEH